MPYHKIIALLSGSPEPLTKAQIAKHLKIKGTKERAELKTLLRQLRMDKKIQKYKGGRYGVSDSLPPVTPVQIVHTNKDGDLIAKLVDNHPDGLTIIVKPTRNIENLGEGDRFLARLKRLETDEYEAVPIKKFETDSTQQTVVGLIEIFRNGKAFLKPANKKTRNDYHIKGEVNPADDNKLALAELIPNANGRAREVSIKEIIGSPDNPKSISLLSLSEVGLQEEFPKSVVSETEGMKVPPLETKKGKREDLRKTPLVTIDGADARDFDDAVFAEPTKDGGYHIIVAIADVAYYVREGTDLNKEAYKRGNSTYFPDRVVPMLPEALSNDLCSLRPDEDRACMAAHLYIDAQGKLTKYKFTRALMRSHARLTYEKAQDIYNAGKGEHFDKLQPLYEAYRILDKARERRGALDLDMPERQIIIGKDGYIEKVVPRARLDSHKLIEECMVLANVAAAKALEDKNAPCVYRIHDRPSFEKLEASREFVEGFGYTLPKTGIAKPDQINHVLRQARDSDYSHLISQMILRMQSQAVYSPNNIGHFGLALQKYAHFTSPIRRYADLLVHRSLIRAYGLGEGGLSDEETVRMTEMAEHISTTERTSMEAERNATDRFTAAFLAEKTGEIFPASISGVTKFGLFIALKETGADGLIPIRTIPGDYYIHDEKAHALVGRRTGRVFRMGAKVLAKLVAADPLTGAAEFELHGDSIKGAEVDGAKPVKKPSPRTENYKGKRSYKGKRGGKSTNAPKNKKKTTPKHRRKKK